MTISKRRHQILPECVSKVPVGDRSDRSRPCYAARTIVPLNFAWYAAVAWWWARLTTFDKFALVLMATALTLCAISLVYSPRRLARRAPTSIAMVAVLVLMLLTTLA